MNKFDSGEKEPTANRIINICKGKRFILIIDSLYCQFNYQISDGGLYYNRTWMLLLG